MTLRFVTHAPETTIAERSLCGRCPRCHPGRQFGGDEVCARADCGCHKYGGRA